MCAVGGWGPTFGTKSQKTVFLTPSLNRSDTNPLVVVSRIFFIGSKKESGFCTV